LPLWTVLELFGGQAMRTVLALFDLSGKRVYQDFPALKAVQRLKAGFVRGNIDYNIFGAGAVGRCS
jgi:hypothetical protein